jgi:putative membrane protein
MTGSHSESSMVATLALLAVASVYLRNWYRLQAALADVLSVRRLTAFLSGLFTVWIVVGSPLAALDHQLLTAHMAQHLLLMTVAAPLILLGAPAVLFPRVVRSLSARGFGRVLTHPVFCWLASTVTVIGWHIPEVFAIGMHSLLWHEIEHASFFVAGLLFWWPVIQPWPSIARWPRWSVPLYLFLATLPCDALSAFLTFCNRVVYPHYLSAPRVLDLSPLGDQECAGALMWIWVTFAYLIPAVAVTIQLLSPQRIHSRVEAV